MKIDFDYWYKVLRRHRAVEHPLFTYLECYPYDKHAWRVFVSQHAHIVRAFPNYMKLLFPRLDDESVLGLQIVYDDEVREDGVHADMQMKMVKGLSLLENTEPLPAIIDHIHVHELLMREGDELKALGALGPGHEAIIPTIFRRLISGAPAYISPQYLFAHLEQDPEHDRRFREVIQRLVDDNGLFVMEKVREGAEYSLNIRGLTWDAIYHKILLEKGK
jgi:pyrroloquinoline quinone (PQQ) biosynthesis protein C